ncbi:uncharacterized protein [Dysidea avara]|uniref:uncharacterized protein isoform X2 n=1 Tax=Dysidea avara TaxID=196820 RepID=UPI00332A1E6F
MGADNSKRSQSTTSTDKYSPSRGGGRRSSSLDSTANREVTSQLHQFLVESQLSGMERLLLAANVTSMKKLLDADEEELGNHGITSAMVHRLTVKLKKYINKHPEVDDDEDMPSNQARSQSLVMDGFPSIVQRLATNRPLSDTFAAPNTGTPVSNRSFSGSDIVSGRLYQPPINPVSPTIVETLEHEDNSTAITTETEANGHVGGGTDQVVDVTIEGQHTLSERQGSLTPLSPSNIEDSPVITRDSLRRISSVPEGDLRDSLDHLNILEYAPSMATASPSLPRTGTMLMREHQDQQMTTLLSSVSAVLKMLKKSSEVSELMMAAQSMSLLCGRVTNRQHAIHCGALETFADAIPKAYDDPKLIEEYCRSLKYLMHKAHIHSSSSLSLVVIPVLVDVLKRFSEYDITVVQTLITLASFCRVGVDARQVVADHDGIQTTLIVMEIGSLDPQIQSCGLALLSCAIVEMPQLKVELSGSCDAIIRHMQNFEEHAMVQMYGCSVFAAMTADCPSLVGQLAAASVMAVIIDVMRCHSSDSSVLLWAIKALANMTIDEERCGDITVEGGVGQIIIAMKKFMKSSGIQTWGAYALCRILYCNRYCLQAVLKHGIETVILERHFGDETEAGTYITKLESLLVELQQ